MGTLSPWHIAIIVIIGMLLLGGKGKISGLMEDAAKGIKAFRKGLNEP